MSGLLLSFLTIALARKKTRHCKFRCALVALRLLSLRILQFSFVPQTTLMNDPITIFQETPVNARISKLVEAFETKYASKPTFITRAPGRVWELGRSQNNSP